MDIKILRKRKRTAIDPCLGYYEASSSIVDPSRHDNVKEDTRAVVDRADDTHDVAEPPLLLPKSKPLSRISEIPHISPKSLPQFLPPSSPLTPPPPTVPPERHVTVNDFLSRNGKGPGAQEIAKKRKTYSTRRSKRGTVEIGAEAAAGDSSIELWDIPDALEASSADDRILLGLGGNEDDGDGEEEIEETTRNLRLRNRTVRSRVVILSGSESDSSSSSGSSSHGGAEYTGSPSVKRRKTTSNSGNKKRKEKKMRTKNLQYRNGKLVTKSLGTRLFEASVATLGKPLDSLVMPHTVGTGTSNKTQPSTAGTRKPLEFVPLSPSVEKGSRSNHTGPRSSTGTFKASLKRRATWVDPRKVSDPFSRAAFCSSSQLVMAAAATQRNRHHRQGGDGGGEGGVEGSGQVRDGSERGDRGTYQRISSWKNRTEEAAAPQLLLLGVAPSTPGAGGHPSREGDGKKVARNQTKADSNGAVVGKRRARRREERERDEARVRYPPLEFVPMGSVTAARHVDKKRKKKDQG